MYALPKHTKDTGKIHTIMHTTKFENTYYSNKVKHMLVVMFGWSILCSCENNNVAVQLFLMYHKLT